MYYERQDGDDSVDRDRGPLARWDPRLAGPTTGRGQTGVIAVVILVGIVAVGSIGVLVTAGSLLEESKTTIESERTEQGLRQLDKTIDSVAAGRTRSATVDLDLPADSRGAVREASAGRLVVIQRNLSAGRNTTLVNRSLGAIVYEGDRRTIAYQAGGLWVGEGASSRVLSAPPFSYETNDGREPTLTVPLPVATGDRRLTGGAVRVEANGTASPLANAVVREGNVIVLKLTSQYYGAWADYFRSTVQSAGVGVDAENETVVVRMVVPVTAPEVDSGVVVGAAQETLKLKQYATVDGYNSSAGDYGATKSDQTRVVAAGDVVLQQNSRVRGDLVVGGDATFKQDTRVRGNFSHDESSSLSFQSSPSTHVDGWIGANASVGARTAVDGVIDRKLALARDNNDNASTPAVSNGRLQGCSSTCTLTAGRYLLEEIDLGTGEKLVLDTTSGDITLVVVGAVSVYDGTIEVVGDGRADVYVDSETGSEDVAIKQDGSVTVQGDRAPNLWVYTDSDAEARLRQSANFTGVVYGPGRSGQTGTEISASSTAGEIHVHGALVGDVEPITQEVNVHYDEALVGVDPIRTTTAVPRLSFLHVSVRKVDLRND